MQFHAIRRALKCTSLLMLVFVGFLVGGPSQAASQDVPPLFVETGEERVGEDKVKVRSRRGQIDFAILEALLAGEVTYLRLNLFEDVEVIVRRDRIQQWNASEFTWMGSGVELPENHVALEIDTSKHVLFATLTVGGWPYRIEHVEDAGYVVYQIDTSTLRDEPPGFEEENENPDGEREPLGHGEGMVRIGGPVGWPVEEHLEKGALPQGAPQDEASSHPVIDVLVLYTSQAADSAGSYTQMVQEIRNAFNHANASFQDSGVNARLRLAAAVDVQYDEASQNGSADMLGDLKSDGNNSGSVVQNERDRFGADIVGLVVGELQDACGRGYVMSDVSTSFRSSAFFVVEQGYCLGGYYSFAHEIGHVMGVRHDRYVDDKDGAPYDYNHGYVNINDPSGNNDIGWRTIMGYDDECEDQSGTDTRCNRIRRWSDPGNTWTDGNAMGVATGSEAADNVRALNNTASTVAAFKSPMPMISGTITDLLTGGGLEDADVGGFYGPVTDASGYYERVVPRGEDVTIRPLKGEYTFSPASRSYANVTADQTGQDYDATITYLIHGRVTDASGSGVGGIEMSGAPPLPANTTTNEFGFYQLEAEKGWSGTITPVSSRYDFSPSSTTYTNLAADQEQDYAARIATYTVSGYVKESGTGTPISGVKMDGFYPADPRRTEETDASGFYSVTRQHGWSGTIEPRKVGYNFQPFSTSYDSLTQHRQTDYFGTQQALAESSWPLFGAGLQHRRTVETSAVVRRVKWTNGLGGGASSAVVGSNGTVYIGAGDGSMYAYADDGTLLWQSKALRGDSITASPAAGAGQRIYAPSRMGGLAAYDQGGSIAWTVGADEPFYSSPLIDASGTLYIGSDDDSLYAFVAADGARLWAFGTDGDVRSSPAAGADGTLYVGSDDDSLYAVGADGSLQWSYGTGGDVRSSPAVDTSSGTVYVGSDDGYLHAVDAASGTRRWRYQTGAAVRSSPALGPGGIVYVGSDDGYVYAMDAASGTRQWRYQTSGAVRSSPAITRTRVRVLAPTLYGGRSYTYETTVFVGASDGTLYALDASPNAGSRLHWTYGLGGDVTASPAIGARETSDGISGGLYVGSDDGTLHALALQGEASATVSQLALGADQSLLERAHIIIWEHERGGPLGLIGAMPGDDPCGGGPLIIPDCDRFGTFGETSAPWRITAGVDLVAGLATGENVDPIVSGETSEGLLGTVPAVLAPGSASNLVLGGLTEPEAFAPNPDGRPTALALFEKSGLAERTGANPEQVSVYAGHFSTDAPALRLTLHVGEEALDLGTVRYGDFSETKSVPPGHYEATLEVVDGAPGKTASATGAASLSRTVDLRGREGEPVGLLVGGFVQPEANQNGPALDLLMATVDSSSTTTPITGTAPSVPEAFVLHDNFPNPFRRATTIRYELPEATHVQVEVFDALGRRVAVLADEYQAAGRREVRFEASRLSGGVYVCRLEAGSFVETRRIVLVK